MKYYNNKGFTLIETMIVLGIMSTVSVAGINSYLTEEELKADQRFSLQVKSIVDAVDHRLATDGFDAALWGSKRTWGSQSEISDDLIEKKLNTTGSNCPNGEWVPTNTVVNDVRLLDCGLFKKKQPKYKMSAELLVDSIGFVEGFNIYVDFANEDVFKDKYMNLKKSMINIKSFPDKEMSGEKLSSFINKNTGLDMTTLDCTTNQLDCSMTYSLSRASEFEYLRADGGNDLMNNINFIANKNSAPLTCITWNKDSSGNWTVAPDTECGIGIFEGTPVSAELFVNGTVSGQNVVLQETCKVFEWDDINKIAHTNNGKTAPCGFYNDGSSVIQVVDNISSNNAIINSANIENVIARNVTSESLSARTLKAISKLEVQGLVDFNNDVLFKNNASVDGILNAVSINTSYIAANTVKTNDIISDSNTIDIHNNVNSLKNIDIQGHLKSNNGLTVNGNSSLNGTTTTKGLTVSGASNFNNHVSFNSTAYASKGIRLGSGALNGGCTNSTVVYNQSNTDQLLICSGGRYVVLETNASPSVRTVSASAVGYRWATARAYCGGHEVRVGGGGGCSTSVGYTRMPYNGPTGTNGWQISCDTDKKTNSTATSHVLCMQK